MLVERNASPTATTPRVAHCRSDHVCVRRQWGYDHHGIYVDDDHIIQFGGRICYKFRANIEAVSLEKFEDGGAAEVVPHGVRRGGFDGFHGSVLGSLPADPPERVVERAEWLHEHHPAGRYDPMGWNWEHAANFCVNEQ